MHDAETLTLVIVVVILAISFDFINGFHDSANAIATSVVTRALSMRNAVLLAAGWNFFGAMTGIAVAKTIGKDIVHLDMLPKAIGQTDHTGQVLVLAALVAAIIWNLVTWWKGLPSSSSHALIGGIIGAGLAAGGIGVLSFHGITKIVLSLLLSPIIGFIAGGILMLIVMNIFAQHAPSRINKYFKGAQVVSASFMAYSHGLNDAQKSMGIITMALLIAFPSASTDFIVPSWVKLTCASAMALGSAMGGWRIIKTVGKKVMGWQPVHGFASETAAAAVVMVASHFGAPVSTTHVISSAIMGVGATKRLSAVRWGIVRQIVGAWLMTLPVSAALGALCFALLHLAIH